MNYRMLFGLIIAFSYQTITFAMNNQAGPVPAAPAVQGPVAQGLVTNLLYTGPQQQPLPIFERFKNHVSRNAALYVMGGAIAAGMGLFLYMDHRSKVRIKKMFEKDEKKRLKQTMDLVTFNDEKFLKTVT
jgi:hypothetical protein